MKTSEQSFASISIHLVVLYNSGLSYFHKCVLDMKQSITCQYPKHKVCILSDEFTMGQAAPALKPQRISAVRTV